MIPYGRQTIDDDDVAAVVQTLRSDFLTQGPKLQEFEENLASLVGARHAVAFANGTAALHGAAAAGGLGKGSLVATTPLSFVASANCARYLGADVTFIDIDAATLNMDPALVPDGLDGLVPVHYAGLPMDLTQLPYRPRVIIEDAAHALGAMTPDGPVGNCAHSDMCAFSFHPVKTVTTGEGGAVTTNSDELADAMRKFRSHGTVRKPEVGGWYYEVETVGYNYRLTDIQAALGISQLRKLDRFVERRNEIAQRYRDRVQVSEIIHPPTAPTGWRHAYHLYPVRVPNRKAVYDELHARGIAVQVHYVLIPRHPLYSDAEAPPSIPHAQTAYEGLLSLPMFPSLTDTEQDLVIEELARAVAITAS